MSRFSGWPAVYLQSRLCRRFPYGSANLRLWCSWYLGTGPKCLCGVDANEICKTTTYPSNVYSIVFTYKIIHLCQNCFFIIPKNQKPASKFYPQKKDGMNQNPPKKTAWIFFSMDKKSIDFSISPPQARCWRASCLGETWMANLPTSELTPRDSKFFTKNEINMGSKKNIMKWTSGPEWFHSNAFLNKKKLRNFGASSDFVGRHRFFWRISYWQKAGWKPSTGSTSKSLEPTGHWCHSQVAWGCHVARIRQAAHEHAIIILFQPIVSDGFEKDGPSYGTRLPETNSSHLKHPGLEDEVPFGFRPPTRCELLVLGSVTYLSWRRGKLNLPSLAGDMWSFPGGLSTS